jgi:hypothetical protein
MPNLATMENRSPTAKKAASDIERWLRAKTQTSEVINVEDDPDYRKIDVDLIWKYAGRDIKVEIKGDTYHRTGNFFLETHSNEELNKPGCFMYTESDYVFYYFVEIKKLYVMPMPETREWFQKHKNEFRESRTQTDVGNGNRYTTVGRLVPIKTLIQNVPNIKEYQL